jgi:2,3-bisphosphoglycerate-dependent phosphoglycerate mutase
VSDPVKDFILVRHGESEHHVAKLYGGWTTSPLTIKGIKQAQATAERLKRYVEESSCHIVSSDLVRARETARQIANTLGLSVETCSGLREMSGGVAEGLPQTVVETLRQPRTAPVLDWIPFEGAESWRMMQNRVGAVLDTLTNKTGYTIIVGHGHSLICAVNWFLDFDERAVETFMYRLDPCSISHLRLEEDGSRSIERLNDTAHLSSL